MTLHEIRSEQHTIESAFGGCPECGELGAIRNIGRQHWGTCDTHRTRWLIGSNLFDFWRDETETSQRLAYEVEPGWGHYTNHDTHEDGNMTRDRQTDRFAEARARHHAATQAHRQALDNLDAAAAELTTAGAALAERVRLLERTTRPTTPRRAA